MVVVYNGDTLYSMCNRTEAEEIFPTITSIVSSASSRVYTEQSLSRL
jgi:hypothetical protein